MRLRILRSAVCITLVLAALPAAAKLHAKPPSSTADERAIVAGERAWGQAYVSGDVAAADRLLADDFVGVDPSGKLYDKAQVLKDVRAVPHATSDEVGAVKVRFYGDTAIAQAEEHEVGPAPEFKPGRHMFTDTWIKRGGRWRIVAAEDLDMGSATLPAFAADREAIIALRAENNRAIAAHDLATFAPVFADDANFTWSNGTHANGKAELEAFFKKDFADATFVAYIRTPERVAVSETGVRAVEHGTWTALKRDTRYGGDYMAHWVKTPDGWFIKGEVYVKLRCTGPLCTP